MKFANNGSVSDRGGLPLFWTIQLVGWVLYFVVIYITFLTIAQPGNFLNLLIFKAFRTLTGLLLTSFVLRPIYSSLRDQTTIARLGLLVFLCSAILGTVWTAIEFGYIYFTGEVMNFAAYLSRSPRIALDYAMTLSAWSSLYLGIKFWVEWQTERENALRSAALTQKAQLEMLRYQVNPHFLFNTLNSVRALINEDAQRATQMITQLAEFMRFSLLSRNNKKIPLRDEMEAIRNYLSIEEIRFEDKLCVHFDVQREAEEIEVPYLLLNPLVENAVKHGNAKPLQIGVSAIVVGNRLVIEITNSGTLRDTSTEIGTSLGLSNVRERLQMEFGKDWKLELVEDEGLVRVRIEIPYEVQNCDH